MCESDFYSEQIFRLENECTAEYYTAGKIYVNARIIAVQYWSTTRLY